jgi:signal transduction histidine kinase
MTVQPGAMTDYELRREIEHHRGLIANLSPEAPVRKSLQAALDAYLDECEERVEVRSVSQTRVLTEYPEDTA